MNKSLSFFADENISNNLIEWIKQNGFEISGVKEENICGVADQFIIEKCFAS